MAYFENGEFGLLRNLLRDPLSEVRDPLLWGPAVALRPAKNGTSGGWWWGIRFEEKTSF